MAHFISVNNKYINLDNIEWIEHDPESYISTIKIHFISGKTLWMKKAEADEFLLAIKKKCLSEDSSRRYRY